ncbi:MAG: hypothetical protein JXR83_05155 [Deltaproteobacteria bacterium]|nr:hypothetical protein [Deltaproteobacteria bacterium]
MQYDRDKVDDMTLALLYLVTTREQGGEGGRAWKGLHLETMRRLQQKGWIKETSRKSLSLQVTAEGFRRSEQLFFEHFGKNDK